MEISADTITRIKNGDEECFRLLLEDYKKIIYKIIYSRNLEIGDYMIDVESLYQEGSLALYKAVFTYKLGQGMSFSSYAYMVIRARINTYIRDNVKKYEDDCKSIDNFENIDYHISMTSMSVSESPIGYHKEQEFKERLNEFVSKLNDEDKQILSMRMENYSYKDISMRLKSKTKRVDNRLRILRKRLREYLDE